MITEKNISLFIESQFPEVYRENGPNFIEFVKKYYEWMEQTNNVMYHTRRISDYRDVDTTIDQFIINLKEQYLNGIQLDTAEKTRQLIKHSLDLYRSKGSDQSVDLFFRAVFGKPASVFYPADNIFKTDDGHWRKPTYLEVTPSDVNFLTVNKQIYGLNSKATAFVERFVRKKVNSKYVNLLFISAINGNFQTDEQITIQGQNLKNLPFVIGSLTDIEIVAGGTGFVNGDVIEIISSSGVRGQGVVSNVVDTSGTVDFTVDASGWGYSSESRVIISNTMLLLTNVVTTDNTLFRDFSQFIQPNANVSVFNASMTLNVQPNDTLSIYYANNLLSYRASVINVTNQVGTNATLLVNETYGNINSTETISANLAGNVTCFAYDALLSGFAKSFSNTAVLGNSSTYNTEIISGDIVQFVYFNSNNILLGSENLVVNNVVDSTHFYVTANTSYTSNNVMIRLLSTKKLIGNGTSFNSLAYGTRIGIYSNSTTYNILTVDHAVNNSVLYVQEEVSFSNNNTKIASTVKNNKIYFNANVINANIATYTTEYASGNIVGTGSTANLFYANISLSVVPSGSILYHVDVGNNIVGQGIVNNYIYDGRGNGVFNINTFSGAFRTNLITYIGSDMVNAQYTYADLTLGVFDQHNQYYINAYHNFSGNTTAQISRIGTGSLAGFSVNNGLIFTESSTIYNDYVGTYFNIQLSSPTYGFPSMYNANLSSSLYTVLNVSTDILGGIGTLGDINPGINYDIAPIIKIYDPIAQNAQYDSFIFNISNLNLFFEDGEIVSQNNGAVALVKTSSDMFIEVQRISLFDSFVLGQTLTGRSSGATANLVSKFLDTSSEFLGIDAQITANVQAFSGGTIQKVKITDSGFGYLKDEYALIKKEGSNIVAEGKVISEKQGQSYGYYENTDGFLDDKNVLYDGYYYQDYSYVIRTSITFDKYADMLKNIIHVAGTKAFFEIVYESFIQNDDTNIFSEITT